MIFKAKIAAVSLAQTQKQIKPKDHHTTTTNVLSPIMGIIELLIVHPIISLVDNSLYRQRNK